MIAYTTGGLNFIYTWVISRQKTQLDLMTSAEPRCVFIADDVLKFVFCWSNSTTDEYWFNCVHFGECSYGNKECSSDVCKCVNVNMEISSL